MSLNSSQRRIRKSGSKRKGLEVYSLKYQGTITAIDKNDTNFSLYLGDLYWVNPGSLQVSSGTGLCTAVKEREGEVRKGRKRRNRAEGADLWARSSNLLWLCIIFCKVKLTEMEAILHGTVAMANKWEFCGLNESPQPHLPPLMTAATCCFTVTAGASSHSLVLSSAHEHQALSSPHYFDELFMVSTHEDLIEDSAHRLASGSAVSHMRC